MVSRSVLLLAALVVLAGASVVGGEVVDAPPTFTVSNSADATFEVTAFTADSRERALVTNVRVTTENGSERLVTVSQLIWPDGYRNLTVVDDVRTQHLTVEPGEETTTTIESWEPGDVTVYLAENASANGTHRLTRIRSCTQREQEHTLSFENGGSGGSGVCASSLDRWLA